jgi:hypothetical protein
LVSTLTCNRCWKTSLYKKGTLDRYVEFRYVEFRYVEFRDGEFRDGELRTWRIFRDCYVSTH